jgi:hypothetical protein
MTNKNEKFFPSNKIIGTSCALLVAIVLTDICTGGANLFWNILTGGMIISLSVAALVQRNQSH